MAQKEMEEPAALSKVASGQKVPDEDFVLLARVIKKDTEAFESLYRQYYRRLFHFIFRITRRSDMVEEVLNDTLFVVWQNAHRFDQRSLVSTWIQGIAYRKSLKALSRSNRHPLDPLPESMEPIAKECPAGSLEADQLRRTLNQALATLSPEHRAVIELTYFNGHSYRDIATIVGCPENTVKTRMFHARERLRKILGNRDDHSVNWIRTK